MEAAKQEITYRLYTVRYFHPFITTSFLFGWTIFQPLAERSSSKTNLSRILPDKIGEKFNHFLPNSIRNQTPSARISHQHPRFTLVGDGYLYYH